MSSAAANCHDNQLFCIFSSGLSHLATTSTPLSSRSIDLIKHSGQAQAVNLPNSNHINGNGNGSILAGTIASSAPMSGPGSGGLKPLLPFSITPPRQNGPSEAERKIEALTKQLEEELEKEEESEYFGKKLISA